MRLLVLLTLAASIVVRPSIVLGEEAAPKQPPAEKAPQERVHLGSTSVTVVDEHETVDDVITRLRAAKSQASATGKTKSGKNQAPPASTESSTAGQSQDGRATLRAERETAAAHADADRSKDDRRERAANARGHTDKKQRR